MNDATKAAVDSWLRFSSSGHAQNILAWLDGEPARQQAACDRRAEEVREACVREVLEPVKKRDPGFFGDHPEEIVASRLRRTRLTATPLGDEIAALRARVAELEAAQEALLEVNASVGQDCNLRADKAEARVAELERWEVTGRAAHAENVTLKADLREVVEALRALRQAQGHVLEVTCAGDDAYMTAMGLADAVLAKHPAK